MRLRAGPVGMTMCGMADVTQILSQIESGDPSAAEQLLPLVYDELRKLAAVRLAEEKPGQTLQATALVHEAYVRLVGSENSSKWNSRHHFFGAAAEAMRRILVERSRYNRRIRHGGKLQRQNFAEADVVANQRVDDIFKVDAALDDLETLDPRAAELVKLRFFAGMSNAEAAIAMDLSTRTVERIWVYAKAWLREELSS
jgi:RNA polymerase sigma factor (TIGR02999 family)